MYNMTKYLDQEILGNFEFISFVQIKTFYKKTVLQHNSYKISLWLTLI